MKHIVKYLVVIITVVIFLSGCLKDPCTGIFCFENGECINGTCLCENKYIGAACENSYASYFAGNYVAFNEINDSLNDTILINVHNSTDSISINNYAKLSTNLTVLATVQNDSSINIFEQTTIYFEIDSVEQTINVSGAFMGKPTDTIQLMSIYTNGAIETVYNKKLLKITN